ncbi:MAG: HD domain-containing protein [Spirochaetales bacterium]|nr:MAG: HD domain-containing protein [Spirochaetales bacterium]
MHCSFSALDAYFGVSPGPVRFLWAEGGVVELASGHDGLSFPGLPYADAADDTGEPRLRFQCAEGDARPAFPQLRLLHDPAAKRFYARGGVYETLHTSRPRPDESTPELVLFEAAILASRYAYEPETEGLPSLGACGADCQRDLLDLIITGAHPEKGLEILRISGFLDSFWPDIAGLTLVDHVKDFHPEGDAWRHTLETFAHRKSPDQILSLALLLHDAGKLDAVANEGRRFDRHSELGERTARNFLRKLGYPQSVVDDVAFLVRNHMLPAALPRIPPSSIENVLRHPLFPTLLEVYRCDELSTFRGPDGYYEACAVYKAYLRNVRNPYRGPDGKKRALARSE